MRRLLICCAVLLALDCGTVSLAQREIAFKQQTVGDWTVIEDAQKNLRQIKSQEIENLASTKALNGRGGELGISDCGRFGVTFSLYPDDVEFSGTEPPITDHERVVFSKVLPRQGNLSAIVLDRGMSIEMFYFNADSMVSGSKFLICPTQEEGPRCLTFSLRGITTALKMVCPKR